MWRETLSVAAVILGCLLLWFLFVFVPQAWLVAQKHWPHNALVLYLWPRNGWMLVASLGAAFFVARLFRRKNVWAWTRRSAPRLLGIGITIWAAAWIVGPWAAQLLFVSIIMGVLLYATVWPAVAPIVTPFFYWLAQYLY